MRCFVIYCFICWFHLSVFSQQIVGLEYFIDNDPGLGNGTYLAVTPANNVDEDITVDITSLSPGPHKLYVRALDADGNWGLYASRAFYRFTATPGSDIVGLEYFIDDDPGLGNATYLAVTPANNVDEDITVDITSLPPGPHKLYVRALDADGNWGLYASRAFYRFTATPGSDIVGLEYFIDDDPGLGNATYLAVTPANNVDEDITVDITSLPPGPHKLYVRALDADGNWGLYASRAFYRYNDEASAAIHKIEYFIKGENPYLGYNDIEQVDIPPVHDIDEDLFIYQMELTNLNQEDTLYVRVQDTDGNWSLWSYKEFTVDDCSDNSICTNPTAPPPAQVDILVLYTTAALNHPDFGNGSPMTAQNSAQQQVGYFNTASANSNVVHTLNLIGTEEVIYSEGSMPITEIYEELKKPNSILGSVANSHRELYGADVVVLIVDNNQFNFGIADLPTCRTGFWDNEAFAVVNIEGLSTQNYSFVHELGHVFSLDHDIETINNNPFGHYPEHSRIYTCGKGYISPDCSSCSGTPQSRFRTMMAKNDNTCNQGCSRILYWSNPDVSDPVNGIPTGTANANSAAVLNEVMPIVANYRMPTCPPIQTLTSFSESKTYNAANFISVTGLISNGLTIELKAKNHITLEEGFEVAANASLVTAIEDCPYNLFQNAPSKLIPSPTGSIPINHILDSLRTTKNTKIFSAEIMDVSGKTIFKSNDTEKLNAESSVLEQGLFLINIKTEEGVIYDKILIY